MWSAARKLGENSDDSYDDDSDDEIPFAKKKFWISYATTAMDVTVNVVVAAILFLIFYLTIWVICKTIRKTLAYHSKHAAKPLDAQLVAFVITAIKLLLWIQIVPILVNQVGIAVDSVIAVLGAITVGIGLSLRATAENFVAGEQSSQRWR